MIMKTERWINDESFVNGDHERTVNAKLRAMNARWKDGERTLKERKFQFLRHFRCCFETINEF